MTGGQAVSSFFPSTRSTTLNLRSDRCCSVKGKLSLHEEALFGWLRANLFSDKTGGSADETGDPGDIVGGHRKQSALAYRDRHVQFGRR